MKVIVISGSMGAGKTTVMAEASDILSANGIVHAAIDADTLGIVFQPSGSSTDLMYRNLAVIWANFAAAGVNRLLLAEAVEHRGELERIRMAVPGAEIAVCRLIARTDRAVEFTGLAVYRIRDGKIAESRGEIDFLRLIRELRRP